MAVDRFFQSVVLLFISAALALYALLSPAGSRPVWQLVIAAIVFVATFVSACTHRAPKELQFDGQALTIVYNRGEGVRIAYREIKSVVATRTLLVNDVNLGARWQTQDGKTLSMSAVAEKIRAKQS